MEVSESFQFAWAVPRIHFEISVGTIVTMAFASQTLLNNTDDGLPGVTRTRKSCTPVQKVVVLGQDSQTYKKLLLHIERDQQVC